MFTKTTLLLTVFVFFFFYFVTPSFAAYNGEGIGILSDSDSDEYRADDNRGGTYAATTLNWIELLVKKRNLNFGVYGTWGEPRRSGYKYNWSRSGNRTRDLIDAGQAAGLATQITSGEVKYVLIHMGVNDFNFWNSTYDEVYNGTIDISAKKNEMISKMSQTIDILKNAGATKVILMSLSDPNNFPLIVMQYPNATGRARVSNAIRDINIGWKAKADATGVIWFDTNQWLLQNIIAKLVAPGSDCSAFSNQPCILMIGGEKLRMYEQGNEPHYFRLGDSAGHMGTVANGIVANDWFIAPFNSQFGLNITSFTEYEMLTNAGINVSPTPNPPTPTPTTSIPPTPLPRPCPLLGDTNSCDGLVNALDFTFLSNNFGSTNSKADLNNDGSVNALDFTILSNNFGKSI